MSSSPVPSLTLSIAKSDIARVLETSEALRESLQQLQDAKSTATTATANNSGSSSSSTKNQQRSQQHSSSSTPLKNNRTPRRVAGPKSPIQSHNDKENEGAFPSEVGKQDAENSNSNDHVDGVGGKSSENSSNNDSPAARPLHEMVFEAATKSSHPFLNSFLDKMRRSGASVEETQAAVLLFHDMESLDSKLRSVFDAIADGMQRVPTTSGSDERNSSSGPLSCSDANSNPRALDKDACISLFRSIVTGIHTCIESKGKQIEIEMGQHTSPASSGLVRPSKRMKLDDTMTRSTDTTSASTIPALQSPSRSFDSSLATLKEEEEKELSLSVRKEFEEIANYATESLFAFNASSESDEHEKESPTVVTLVTFTQWNETEGRTIVPWMELLDLPNWKMPTEVGSESQDESAPETAAASDKSEGNQNIKNAPALPKDQDPTPPQNQVRHKKISLEEEKKDASGEHFPPFPAMNHGPSPTFFPHPSIRPPFLESESRTVVSFDFTGSMPTRDSSDAFCIRISEENLFTLKNLVRATGLQHRPTSEICSTLLKASFSRMYNGRECKVLGIHPFRECVGKLISSSTRGLSNLDLDIYYSCFIDFFSCFDRDRPDLGHGECDAYELAVGFGFLCAGTKSSKLASGFDILRDAKTDGLTTEQLEKYLRSYLTMLIGLSLLASSPEKALRPKLTSSRRVDLFAAVENGAKWTLRHYLKVSGRSKSHDRHTFESFAEWYTNGGYNVAPWLELLDLSKVLSLVGGEFPPSTLAPSLSPPLPPQHMHPSIPPESFPHFPHPPVGTPNMVDFRPTHHLPDTFAPPPVGGMQPSAHPTDVMFTFPLANRRSLVVLRDDASYVKEVVEQLGLLDKSPDEVWSLLYNLSWKRIPEMSKSQGNKGKGSLTSKAVFLQCMEEIVPFFGQSRKASASPHGKAVTSAKDLLANLFHSFDLHQMDQVGLNELMGGLTLLCGGKKSTKLAFAFSVFDRRPKSKIKRAKKGAPSTQINSLGGEDLFLFLRSFLIVMFSCCRQSWDLTDHMVGRYIADTANMVTDDVMRYQWTRRKKERVDFDEFGEWYNEGGYETAPWLELLDLRKWVLNESLSTEPETMKEAPLLPPLTPSLTPSRTPTKSPNRGGMACPPPPPEDSVDPSFFVDDENDIMPMDSIDEMDMILMQQPSQDKDDNDLLSLSKMTKSPCYSPRLHSTPQLPRTPTPQQTRHPNSLQFHLVTNEQHGGYMVSVSHKRVVHLRKVLAESGLCDVDGENATKQILSKSAPSMNERGALSAYTISKPDFDAAMRQLIQARRMSMEVQTDLSDLLNNIFDAFEHGNTGEADALELACGFTVLCHGKKSDKLEYAFDAMDASKKGVLSQLGTTRYLWSFLTVLLSVTSSTVLESDPQEDSMVTMSGELCETTPGALRSIVDAGSTWASAQAFIDKRGNDDTICFDEFAEWYTQVGFSNIPWLELLDLKKWALLPT